MGQSQSILYSVEVPDQAQPQNSTKVRRRPQFIKGLIDSPDPELKTLQLILQKSLKTFANNDCLGQIKAKAGGQPGKQEKYVAYKSYAQVAKIAEALDKAIHDLNLSPTIEQVPGLKLRFLGIFSKNRQQWLQVDVSAIIKGYCVVPIYDTLGVETIPFVLNHTKLTTLFSSRKSLDTLLKCQNLGALKNIVSFDVVEEEIISKFQQKGITIHLYNSLIQKYLKSDVKTEVVIHKPDDVVTFCYTSGTTGPPKGAMLSQKNFAAFSAVLKNFDALNLTQKDTHISYLPLAHILQNICVLAMLCFGGRICPFSGDVKNIKNDLELIKPTFFMSVPRLYNRFYDAVKDKFDKTEGLKKTLLDKAVNTKLNNVKQTGQYTHMIYDKIVFNKTKQLFGGHCRFLASGSAPLIPQVHAFMKVISSAPLMQGYGQTQSTGFSFCSNAQDPICGHVGGPSSMVQYKLEDIPEMNYSHKDNDEHGRSAPRGQILMRGPGVFLGYYKDDQKTKEAIDADGWLHTGDVGTILPQTKALKLIDRKKNIFKLQQGQYVSSEKVQAIYTKKSEMVTEIFLYGDSMQNFCVGIISPNKQAIQVIAKSKNINGSYEQLCQNKQIRTQFLSQLNAYSKKQGLNGFQQPKNVYLQTTSFQQKNILTSTLKMQRFAAKTVYKQQIEDMYKQGMLGGKPE